MSSTTRLLVLGVVRIFQPVHGYDVRRELLSWRAHEWASIKSGSIYNALKTLAHDGLLAVVGTDQVGGRPERTTYKLTPAGEDEFRILLHAEWWTVRTPTDPLMAAISFIGYIKRDEAIAALEHRAAQIHSAVRHIEGASAALDGIESPFHVREMHRLLIARVSAEVAWAKLLVERLRKGEYITADDPPWMPGHEPPAPGKAATRAGSAKQSKPDKPGTQAGSAKPASSARAGGGANGKAVARRPRSGRARPAAAAPAVAGKPRPRGRSSGPRGKSVH